MPIKIGLNQYLLAPRGVVGSYGVDCSTSLPFKGYTLFLGEGCVSTIVHQERRSAMLLGYVIDAEKKATDTEDMLNGFLAKIKSDSSNVAECVRFWGGRWCMFYVIDGKMNVITDTCGLKQVFYYTYTRKDFLTIASQARYIAALYSLQENKEARSHIERSKEKNKEYSWPVDSSIYDNVRRLLPNHILTEGIAPDRRYNLSGYYDKDQAAKMASLLMNQMRDIQSREKCAITLTAGWDSRLVLAASDQSDAASIAVTLKYNEVSENSLDIVVPAQIANKVGITHKVVNCRPINYSFEKRYQEHGENAHPYWSQMVQAVEDNNYKDYYWVKGSCNEVLRCSSGILYNWQVDVVVLCKLFQIPYDAYSKRILSQWIMDARTFCDKNDIRMLDLFYWEHRCGSWLSECLNENDMVGETFTPFNCRAYLELGLTVEESERTSPHYSLFDEIIKKCGLIIDIPINSGRYGSMKSKLKCILKNRLHLLYGMVLHFSK